MTQPASSNRTSTSNGPRAPSTSGQPASGAAPAPHLSQAQSQSESGQGALTHVQRTLLNTLCSRAHALRWGAGGKDAATRADVLAFFAELKTGAAQLHAIHDAHPAAPELASCINALEQLLKRFVHALKPEAEHGLAVADFDVPARQAVFGALSALANPAWPPLFNRAQRRALQPLMQDLCATLLPSGADFADAARAEAHLPLLNWICRSVKKDLLKPDGHIAARFEGAIGGIVGWMDADDSTMDSHHIGECAAILTTVIDRDLLDLKRRDEAAQERLDKFTRCALLLCSDRAFAVLARPPVNGVAVVNLCNFVKDLVERGSLSVDRAQAQLKRLLDLIVSIPNETMSGGDGRVLSNAGNFLRMLLMRAPGDGAQREAHRLMLMPACKRVLAALNAVAFGVDAKNAQSLSNLASFLQALHQHAVSGVADEELGRNFVAALDKLLARILATRPQAFDDRRNITGLLDAIAYLQGQRLCRNSTALEAFRSALRARESGLPREKVDASAPLESMDTQLPTLSAEPVLKAAPTGPGDASGEARRRIPGEGAIVKPLPAFDAAQIVPGTTYLRPTAGRGKFARADRVEADAFSLAAQEALVAGNGTGSGASDDEEEPAQARGNETRAAMDAGRNASAGERRGTGGANRGSGKTSGEAGKGVKTRQKDTGRTRRSHSALAADVALPAMAVRNAPDADMISAAIRNGNAEGVERMMQALKGNPQRPLPLLSEAFLAEAGREKFLNDRARVKAMEAYLGFLDKADKDRFAIQLGKTPALSSAMHALLAQRGTGKRYGLSQYAGLFKSLQNVLSNSTDPDEVLPKLSDVLFQADEACIAKLAEDRLEFPELILNALLLLEEEAPTAWYLGAVKKTSSCRQLMRRFMHTALKDALQKNALERLFRQIGAEWLRQPFALMALTPQGAEAPFYSFPMSAIAHARRPVLELMLQMVPKVLAERYLFGFSVLSAAVLKDDADMLLHLLAELPAEVVDTLATEPVLSPEEAKYRRAGAKALEVNLVTLPRFTLGSMPGFNLLALASGSAALRCLRVLLRHDHGRIAVQTSPTHWEEIFAWPDLKPAVREMLEDFMVAHLCRCIPHIGNSADLAHWMECVRHLFFNASSTKGMAPAMRCAVEHKRSDLASLLLNSATRAQLVALKREANASDWAGVFPGIDEPMLAVLKTVEARIDADERDAAAHSSAAASSRAPQSLQ
ncbi:hypothetical protein [Noviherbaspirillum pedocola]|uniref:Uncharacterized protein n=1 Tax=Noviherbaspirillum pedocola TaxID=2801341 RepID=A0A934SZ44_9BURK|nr:hypothetical protein [Noviherbaspirillum pedocola]MBK4738319.1 hypothetical protein [Noviherbaspirillum pedocola]